VVMQLDGQVDRLPLLPRADTQPGVERRTLALLPLDDVGVPWNADPFQNRGMGSSVGNPGPDDSARLLPATALPAGRARSLDLRQTSILVRVAPVTGHQRVTLALTALDVLRGPRLQRRELVGRG